MMYHYSTHCCRTVLQSIRAFLKEKLSGHHVDNRDIDMAILAVDEICANIIIHANCDCEKHFMSIALDVKENGVYIEICHNGSEFDFREYSEPKIDKLLEKRKKGGVGLILVKKIMSSVEFVSNKESNCCKLFKKFGQT